MRKGAQQGIKHASKHEPDRRRGCARQCQVRDGGCLVKEMQAKAQRENIERTKCPDAVEAVADRLQGSETWCG